MSVSAPTTPAASGRSRRPRGARGAGRGADRGTQAARTPPPPHLRGFRGPRGAGHACGLGGSPARNSAGHRVAGVRAVGASRGATSSKLTFISHEEYDCCGRGGPFLLYVINADGSGKRLLTRDALQGLAWSPDGRKIVFFGGPGKSDIYVRTEFF